MVIYDMETRGVARSFQPHSQTVSCLAWSRDGHFLASAGLDGTLSLWRVLDNQQVRNAACMFLNILHGCYTHRMSRQEPGIRSC